MFEKNWQWKSVTICFVITLMCYDPECRNHSGLTNHYCFFVTYKRWFIRTVIVIAKFHEMPFEGREIKYLFTRHF